MPDIAGRLPGFVSGSGFRVLPMQLDHAIRAGDLPLVHRDPFDRMLAAQSMIEGLTVVTRDKVFADYGCKTLW
jgi:PIN domain nuclease of toxin-antitoxin system